MTLLSMCSHNDVISMLPATPATVLALDVLLNNRCIDLQCASDLVQQDLGATLQVLQLVANEHGEQPGRPTRISECLASLPAEEWFNAIVQSSQYWLLISPEASALWEHSRLVACAARRIAQSGDVIFPDQAYLVGLLHDLDSLVRIQQKNLCGVISAREVAESIERILPEFVLSALYAAKDSRSLPPWNKLLRLAHESSLEYSTRINQELLATYSFSSSYCDRSIAAMLCSR